MYSGTNQLHIDLKGGIYAIDSTNVDLYITVFWWATFRSTKSAIKVHTLLDLKTAFPKCVYTTEASVHDVNILNQIELHGRSYLVMDRAYVDFVRLHKLAKDRINFIFRVKSNINFKVLNSGIPETSAGIIGDQCTSLTGYTSSKSLRDYSDLFGFMIMKMTEKSRL